MMPSMCPASVAPSLRRAAVLVLSKKKVFICPVQMPAGAKQFHQSAAVAAASSNKVPSPFILKSRIHIVLAPYSTQSTTDGGDDSLAGESSSKKVYSLREMQQRSQPGQDEPTSRLHYDRNFITAVRAMHDFLLKPEHLAGLRVTSRRSPNDYEPPLNVYWRKDVEAKSVEVWGSREALDRERDRRTEQQQSAGGQEDFGAFFKRYLKKKRRPGPTRINRENWPVRTMAAKQTTAEGLDSQTGRVVITAVAINTFNTAAKLGAWVVTGSHAMFSEAIHSAADTANQLILVYGLRKSAKMADEKHPYGYSNMPYVSSLISGVGIFCMGAGLSIYHGAAGLMNPHSIESLTLAFVVLSASFISESITLVLAVKSIRQSAARYDMGFMEFVLGGYDPCVNVVLLEDLAAVMGVVIAGGAMGASSLLDSHIPDALGSLAIGGLLGCVATFMIYTNTTALVGRSIPEEKLILINRELEGDIMVRQIHDVKGIDMGNGIIRYKAEVDVDGHELALYYLRKNNLTKLFDEVKAMRSEKELEMFLLQHGENIVDCLGEQVDRIELQLKETHPEVKHVDLEVL